MRGHKVWALPPQPVRHPFAFPEVGLGDEGKAVGFRLKRADGFAVSGRARKQNASRHVDGTLSSVIIELAAPGDGGCFLLRNRRSFARAKCLYSALAIKQSRFPLAKLSTLLLADASA
jgi:hypothetical protein